jgi:hypothetical protein
MSAQIVADATFRCQKCSASFPWAAQHVGRLARCKCGNVLKVPPQPNEGVAQVEAAKEPLGIQPQTPAVSAPPTPPAPTSTSSPTQIKADPFPSFLRVPNHDPADDQLDAETEAALAETGRYGEDPEAHRKPDPRRDLQVPVALLVAGAVMTFISINSGSGSGAIMAAVATIITLVISTILFLGGGLLAAHFGGIYLGTLGPALLKFAAVSIFPASLADLITSLLGGDMAVACIGNGVGIVTCWGLVSYLFRLDGPKTITVVISVAIVKVVLGFILFGMLGLMIVSAEPSYVADAEETNLVSDDDTLTAEDE